MCMISNLNEKKTTDFLFICLLYVLTCFIRSFENLRLCEYLQTNIDKIRNMIYVNVRRDCMTFEMVTSFKTRNSRRNNTNVSNPSISSAQSSKYDYNCVYLSELQVPSIKTSVVIIIIIQLFSLLPPPVKTKVTDVAFYVKVRK